MHTHLPALADSFSVFQVFVAKEKFKFNAAHFIAYKGYRERLHGHNYRASIRLEGTPNAGVGADGYVVDFGEIKGIMTTLCKELNERFLLPERSDVLDIKESVDGRSVHLGCEDGSSFAFPLSDVARLPIVHSSAEELARYLCDRVVRTFTIARLRKRNVRLVEVAVAEAPAQEARYCRVVAGMPAAPAPAAAAGGGGGGGGNDDEPPAKRARNA